MKQPPPELIQIGDVLAGKYRVERVLGRGAMGMVVAAMHVDLQERRAIKFMLPDVLDHVEGVERFMREARACARLKSKHVAAVYDVGRLENGAPYIVMEYLEGCDLKDVLRQVKVLPVPQAADYLLQALEAIGEAHQSGIIHRDLKPANIFLATGVGGVPCIKVLDFGIAKLSPVQGADGDMQEMTATAVMMGTPLYMSPEQMRSSRQVDARCDIWSLGVILFRMLTGTMPFQAPSGPELFAAILKDVPPLPSALNPTLSGALEGIILKCLEKNPERRWQSAAELVEALRPYTLQGTAAPSETDSTTRFWRPPQASLPDGWYGNSGGVGAESTQRRAALQGDSLSASMSTTPTQHMQPGPNVPASQRSTGAGPPPQPGITAKLASGPGNESSASSQTGGSWAQTSRGSISPARTTSRRVVLAAALGGGVLCATLVIGFFLLRGGDGGTPVAATSAHEAASSIEVLPAPSAVASTRAPAQPSTSTDVVPTVSAIAPITSQTKSTLPQAQATTQRATPAKTGKPPAAQPANPFD